MGDYYYTKFKLTFERTVQATQAIAICKAIINREEIYSPFLNQELMNSDFFDNSRCIYIFSDMDARYCKLKTLSPEEVSAFAEKFPDHKFEEVDYQYGTTEIIPIYQSKISGLDLQVVCSTKDKNLIIQFLNWISRFLDEDQSDKEVTIFSDHEMPFKILLFRSSYPEYSQFRESLPYTYIKQESTVLDDISDFIALLNEIDKSPVEMAKIKLISKYVVENRSKIFLYLHANKMVPSDLFSLFIEVSNISGNEPLFKAFFQ